MEEMEFCAANKQVCRDKIVATFASWARWVGGSDGQGLINLKVCYFFYFVHPSLSKLERIKVLKGLHLRKSFHQNNHPYHGFSLSSNDEL